MDTGVVSIQEPVFTKTSVEEAPAQVVLDHSTMEVDKANLSTALDDCRNSIVSVESKHEKEEAMKTVPVEEDSKIVKEKANETETDEQGTTYVHAPESFNKTTNDGNRILSDATLEKEKEDDSTQKLEEVIFEKPVTEEDETETKHSQEQEKDIGNISKVFVDTAPVKSGEDDIEKSLDSALEEIPIKTDEVKEEKDSRTVESSVNGTETEHNETVSVEEISRNGENIVKETALEEEPSRDGVSLHDVETTRGVLLETEKEAEPRLDAKEKDETETVNTVVKDPEIVNTEETIVHESISLKENAEPVEEIKNSDGAEKISREVTGDRAKEEDTIQKAEEVEESLTVIETPTIQGEDIESKASKDTEEHEHVLVRDIPQEETLVPKAETVNTSTVQESAEPSIDLKEEEGTVKTVTSSDEMQETITVIEPPKTSPDQRSKDTEEDEHVLGRNMPQGEIFVTEAESLVTQEDTEPIMDLKEEKEQEKTEKFEEIPSGLALKVDKEELKNEMIKVDQVVGDQTMERGLELNESEAEQTGRNRTDETEESAVENLVAHPEVESVEQMEKPSLESPSEVSEETSKTLDEKIEEKPEEEVPPHQEEGSCGSETKEETVSVPESSELGEQSQEERSFDLTPLQEESCLPIEKDKEETKLQKEEVHKHEPSNEEVKSDEVIKVSSASPSEEREGETVVEAKNIEEIKANQEEQVPDKIQRSLETVETVDTEPVKSNEDDVEESLSSVNEEKASRTDETSVNGTEDEHNATVSVGVSKNSENIVHETSPEEIKNSDEAEEISHEVTGDREKKEDITREKEEVQESPTVIETQIIQEEKTEPKASKDTEEHEHALVRDMPQIDTLVTEAEDVNTSTVQEVETSKTLETTTDETEVGQETKEDIAPSLDLKEDKEEEETETAKTVISSDEERPSDQVDVQAQESVEVKSKETLQDQIHEEKHENLLAVPSGGSEKFQVKEPETVLVDKTDVDKVDGTQVMGEQRGLEPKEPEAEQIDRKKPDEAEETPVVESVEKMQSSSLECTSEVSEETSTTVDEKIEEKLQEEEVTLQQEGQEKASYELEIKEETLSVPESRDLGEKSQGEVSYLPKETELQQEQIEKYEAPNNQQSPVEEKSDEVIQVSSASPSEEREGEIVVDAVKVEDIKANEKDQAEEKIQKSREPFKIAEPQSLFPSCSEEKEHETVSDKIEDEKVKKDEPAVQILSEEDATKENERIDEVHKTVETTAVQEEHTRDIGSSLNEKCSMDETQAEEQEVNDKLDEHVDSQTSLVFSEKSDKETLTAEEKKGNEETTVSDMQQGETIVTEADHEAVDTSTVQEAAVFNTLETTINESKAVHSLIGGEEEIQVTKEVTEPSLDVKEGKEQEETETVKTVILSDEVIKDESQGREESVEVKPKEIVQHESTQEKDENLLDIPSGESAEKMQRPSLESPSELSEEAIKTADETVEEKPEEEVTLHQESQETKEETDPVPVPEISEFVVQAKEEESSPPNEQEKERTLQKDQIEKRESTSEEDSSSTHQTPVEEKADEVVEVSSASPSEERKGETLVEAEKIEEIIKASEEEQVADKMQRSLETVETVESHSSFPSPPEEHETVAEAEKIEDGKVKETEPMGDMSDKDLVISEAKDLSLPLEAAGSDGTESSELAAGSEEQKPKQVKENLDGEKMEVDETKAEELPSSETTPQETLSHVVAVQIDETKAEELPSSETMESIERQEELAKDKEMEETTVAQEEQTRDIETSLTEKFSMDQTQPEEQVNEENIRDEQEKVSSTEEGETKTKDLEAENMDEHVDSSEKFDQETLVAETTKEVDGSGTSKTSENLCIKQEEFETLEAPKLEESNENKSQEFSETIEAIESKGDQTPSFISELEDQIPKHIEEIHEEETKEDQTLEKSQDDQTPSLVSEQVEEIHEEEEETKESHKVEATSGQDLPVETSQAHQIPSSKLVSELEDQIPKQIEEIHEEETKEDLETSQDGQTPSLVSEQVEEIHEEEKETKEPHKVEATSGQDLPVETSQAHQTPSSKLVSELDDKTPKQIEDIHEEEETKSHQLQEEEILPTETVPRELLREAPVSMLASKEDDQVAVQESNCAGDTQEKEESVGETEPKESEAERTETLDDKVTLVEDEDTKKTDVEVAETTKEQSMMTHAPENVCVEQEELKDLETLQPGEIIEGKDSLKNDNSDDFTFSTDTGEAEHVDETSSTLPVVGILKDLQTTLEKSERAVNDSEAESCGIDLHSIKAEPEILEKNLVVEESPASEIIEANMLQQDERGETEKIQEENGLADKSLPVEELKSQEEHEEEGKVQDSISREFDLDAEEKLHKETREIAEFKEETPADQSLKEVVHAEKTPLPSEELEHVVSSENQVEQEPQQDLNASTSEKISLIEEDPRDVETSKKEQNAETHVHVKEKDQIVDIQEEKKNEVRDEKLNDLSATRDTEESFSSEVKKDQEDESELGLGHDSAALQVEKVEEAHSVLGNDEDINEVVTPEKQITDPMVVVKKASEAEHESNEARVECQAISDDTKSNNDRDFPTEEAPKDQSEDANADTSSTKEAFDVQVKDQPKDFEAPVTDKDTTEQEKKSNDLIYVQEDIGTNVKPEVRGLVVGQKEETSSKEEKSEVDYVKTEPEDAIRHGDSTEEKHKASEKIDEEATKEIYQEENMQTETVAAIKDEIKEEKKETTHESFNTKKNTDDATEKTKPEIPEIENSSSISDTQDKSSKFEKQETEEIKKKDEVPNQQKREIADEVPKLESLKTAEELQQRDGESEPTVKEPARKSLSDLIQKVKVTDKAEVATTEPRIEEEAKAEEQDEDGEEHKDDKTSPDSIVMVEAKDTVSIIKTHKKSQGILSGVGSKVKHSISKVKKALTGKSSHTTKPSSPQ